MIAQVVTLCDFMRGELQQALMMARALARLPLNVRLVSLNDQTPSSVRETLIGTGVDLIEASADHIPAADISIAIGLWDPATAEAAVRLSRNRGRLILAPTLYWQEKLLTDSKVRAEALWYVSWHQAAHARSQWNLAHRVEVVRCVIDVERFFPSERIPNGAPWILCRHSRDAPEKFAPYIGAMIRRLGKAHDIVFNMLGALETMGKDEDHRIRTFAQDTIDPPVFLQQGDLWIYAHADYWQETACIAMLEAMASGLPVVVNNVAGIREYLLHGRTGFACADLDEFVDFTVLLMDQPALYRFMSTEARTFVQQHHSLDALTRHLREIL